ncbi:aldehyde dehydrogenase family protein, partial [candidate division KSB1 bacterium]|nr:aldehyde dehydrogenase family protein [candidate division KSB1 bacterium]
KVMCSVANTVKSVVLELGGKDAAVVAADADIRRAAKGVVWGSLFSAGQVCASIERVYVAQPVAEPFIQACLDEIRKVRVGDPLDANTDVGPMTTAEQMQIVQHHLADAVAGGAKILYGGERIKGKGFFIQPTLLTQVDHSMKVMTEETFGPIVAIMAVKDIDEAVRMANDSKYGLSAYGWTRSRATAKKMMRELDAGTVMINDATSSWGEPNAPWVGFKQSGIGLSRSEYGLREMVQVKYVSYDRGNNEQNIWWFPYTTIGRKFIIDAIEFLYQRSLWRKMGALFSMFRNRLFLKTTHWAATIRNIHKAF